MSFVISLIGSLCVFAFIIIIFLGNDIHDIFSSDHHAYGYDLIKNKWLILVAGIVLSSIGTVTKIKKKLKKSKQSKQKYSVTDLHSNSANDLTHSESSSVATKDYAAAQYQHKTQQFIESQSGKLKDLALKVDWSPLRGGGANFKTSFLKRVDSTRIEVAKSKGGLLFSGVFLAAGLGVMSIGGFVVFKENRGFDFEVLFPILFGGIFAFAGLAMLYWPRPRIFDIRKGWFWAGSKSLSREQELSALKYSVRLSDVSALQVISERVSGSKGGSYTSWELNLITETAERFNVMDHGKYESIMADAEMLADYLGVPVWENT